MDPPGDTADGINTAVLRGRRGRLLQARCKLERVALMCVAVTTVAPVEQRLFDSSNRSVSRVLVLLQHTIV